MPRMFKILSLAALLIGGLSLPVFADPSVYGGVWKGSLSNDGEIVVASGIEVELAKDGDARVIKHFLYPIPGTEENGKWKFRDLNGTLTPLEGSQGQFDFSNGVSLLVTLNISDDHHMSLSWVADSRLYELHLTRK